MFFCQHILLKKINANDAMLQEIMIDCNQFFYCLSDVHFKEQL